MSAPGLPQRVYIDTNLCLTNKCGKLRAKVKRLLKAAARFALLGSRLAAVYIAVIVFADAFSALLLCRLLLGRFAVTAPCATAASQLVLLGLKLRSKASVSVLISGRVALDLLLVGFGRIGVAVVVRTVGGGALVRAVWFGVSIG